MLSIEDRKMWAKAEDRARKIKPRVRMIEFGTYEVESSDPTNPPYTVKFTRNKEGRWAMSCTCIAHVGPPNLTKGQREMYQPKPCLHGPSAYSVHAAEVYRRQQSRTTKCGVCGEEATVGLSDGRWFCSLHLDLIYRAECDTPCVNCNSYTALNESGLCQTCTNKAEGEAEAAAVYTLEMQATDTRDLFG